MGPGLGPVPPQGPASGRGLVPAQGVLPSGPLPAASGPAVAAAGPVQGGGTAAVTPLKPQLVKAPSRTPSGEGE